MADGTKIEWTDATWNVITGCSVKSPGCKHCYAMQLAGTRLKNIASRKGLTREVNGNHVWTGEVRFNEAMLGDPLRWRRPRKIFVCAHGDLFHENVPDEWLDRVFAVMALCPQHVFQVLTKRPERAREYLAPHDVALRWVYQAAQIKRERSCYAITSPETAVEWTYNGLPNVWLGVSVEDQTRAEERIPILLDTPAALRWISAEPLLGPIDLLPFINYLDRDAAGLSDDPLAAALLGGIMLDPERYQSASAPTVRGLDWVVAGGESGAMARPMSPDWARQLRDQCAAAGVPFLFKQWGNSIDADSWFDQLTGTVMVDGRPWQPNRPLNFEDAERLAELCGIDDREAWSDGRTYYHMPKGRTGRTLDGVVHDGFPTSPLAGEVDGRSPAGGGSPSLAPHPGNSRVGGSAGEAEHG